MEIFGIRYHTLVYLEVRQPISFSSSQYSGIHCCSHRTSKIFVHAQNFSTIADEWPIRRRSFNERNSYGMFVRSTVTVQFQHDSKRPTILWSHLDELRTY